MQKVVKTLLPVALGNYINSLAVVAPKKAAEKAFKVFSKPRQGAIGPHHQPFLDSARIGPLSVDGLNIEQYQWSGSGPTVLLVHGWESHSHRWKEMVLRLREENYNIIAFDAPGHGYSTGGSLYVPLYEQVLSKMIAKYNVQYVVAHSMGGITALYHQCKNPSPSVQKLVILGAPDRLDIIMKGFQDILGLTDRAMLALDEYFKERFGFVMKDFNSSAFAEAITIPGLVIHDKTDRIAPYQGGLAIANSWKNADFFATSGLGHSLYSKEVNEKIVAFFGQQ